MVERIFLVIPDSFAEQAGANKQKEVRHDNEDNSKRYAESDTQQGNNQNRERCLLARLAKE
jgi:hypothetical protein